MGRVQVWLTRSVLTGSPCALDLVHDIVVSVCSWIVLLIACKCSVIRNSKFHGPYFASDENAA